MSVRTFTLVYDEAPPSVNIGARRGRHWSVDRKMKSDWEGRWGFLLIQAKVPRGMTFASIEALIEFTDARRRDSENYRYPFSKPLADALVGGGWLADDTDDYFELTRVRLANGLTHPNPMVKGRTTIELHALYEKTQVGP